MSSQSPPIEAQRFGRSQTPESPRPVHIPEPSNIPVLLNQMDPVFNDTATYNIPNNQTFSPSSDSNRAVNDSNLEDHDAVQDFLRGAEEESARPEETTDFPMTEAKPADHNTTTEAMTSTTLAQSSYPVLPQVNQIPTDASAVLTGGAEPSKEPQPNLTGDVFSSLPVNEPTVQNESNQEAPEKKMEDKPQDPILTLNSGSQKEEGGVDYQSLLDTISQSASTAPAADAITAPTTAAANVEETVKSMPPIPGLPPKPPPQANAPDFPSYADHSNAQSFNPFPSAAVTSQFASQTQEGSYPLGSSVAQSSLPNSALNAINIASTQLPQIDTAAPGQPQLPSAEPTSSTSYNYARAQDPSERPWTPTTQNLYDQFLEDERRYVTEGIWDKFPAGSRLFVGNLPSEKVTKRDLFHIFHKHGRLAQISIKQAYGFVQYLDAGACYNALNAEQGVEIRGRKIHLEISKPQKNTRGSGASGNKANARRRSRSPERNRNDRFGARPPFSDFRDEPGRRRDDYRPGRSPSPRGYRARDDYRPPNQSSRGYSGQDNRPRSPAYGAGAYNQSPSFDDDASLQLPRRDPRNIPDVQILVLDPQVAQSFSGWVEQGFQAKGLRASTIYLSARLPVGSVVKRQIIEGVQAVVKLTPNNQYNSKIPLQVFDRSSGASNVSFNEYVDLDVPVAADIVIHARQKERGSISTQFPQSQNFSTPYGAAPQSTQQYPQIANQYVQSPQSQYPYQAQPQQYRPPQQGTPVTPNSNAPNLQELLANLRQTPSTQAPQAALPPQAGRPTDLGGLLSNIAARQQSQSQYGQSQPPQPGQGYAGNQQAYGSGQPNVQNIMEQLARYNR